MGCVAIRGIADPMEMVVGGMEDPKEVTGIADPKEVTGIADPMEVTDMADPMEVTGMAGIAGNASFDTSGSGECDRGGDAAAFPSNSSMNCKYAWSRCRLSSIFFLSCRCGQSLVR